jgi:hypothetical protein
MLDSFGRDDRQKNKKNNPFDDLVDLWLDLLTSDPKLQGKPSVEKPEAKKTPVCAVCGVNHAEDDVVFFPAASKKYGNCRVKIPFCYACFDKLLDSAISTFARQPEITDVSTGKPVTVTSVPFNDYPFDDMAKLMNKWMTEDKNEV